MNERWTLRSMDGMLSDEEYRAMSGRLGVSPLLLKLAAARGCRTEEELRIYFYGGLSDLADPHLLKDADLAADLLLDQLRLHGRIGIASDYDVDGIFSAYILYQAITRLGGDARIYTPDRVTEGYGLNDRIVSQASDDGVSLLLTCDNGIAALAPIEYAESLGIVTVVTDHHEVHFTEEGKSRQYQLPAAHAVVDPCREDCPYPFKDLCGTAVAWKLIQILCEREKIPDAEWEELLPFVAFATVADVMDLRGENRTLVRLGFERMPGLDNAGMKALLSVTSVDPAKITAYHVGYILGPCFNAAGRISTVEKAFELLFSRDMKEAMPRALELKGLNDSRKSMTEDGVRQARSVIERDRLYEDDVIVVYLPDCHESLAGIIAGRIRELYSHPVFVITSGENGLKGSGRSIASYSMFEKLLSVEDLLLRFGGHPMAAGITLKEGCLEEFRRRINQDTGLTAEDFRQAVDIDAVIPIRTLSADGVEMLDRLQPCGKGNETPLFADSRLRISRARVRGRKRNVLSFSVEDASGCLREAVYFGDTDEFNEYIRDSFGQEELDALYAGRDCDIVLNLAYYPEIDDYGGRCGIQIVVEDIAACG